MAPRDPAVIRHTVASVSGTWLVAARLARRLRKGGGVLALHGEMGAGKTTFVQGLARALGIRRPVTSPTFALVAEYDAPGARLIHLDLCRLRRPDELLELGFTEFVESGAIVAVEWPERAGDLLPATALHVELALTDAPRRRVITIRRATKSHAPND